MVAAVTEAFYLSVDMKYFAYIKLKIVNSIPTRMEMTEKISNFLSGSYETKHPVKSVGKNMKAALCIMTLYSSDPFCEGSY